MHAGSSPAVTSSFRTALSPLLWDAALQPHGGARTSQGTPRSEALCTRRTLPRQRDQRHVSVLSNQRTANRCSVFGVTQTQEIAVVDRTGLFVGEVYGTCGGPANACQGEGGANQGNRFRLTADFA